MHKLLPYYGIMNDSCGNPSCESLTRFNCVDSVENTNLRLNYFCHPFVASTNAERRQQSSLPQYSFKATYLHIPPSFVPVDFKNEIENPLKGSAAIKRKTHEPRMHTSALVVVDAISLEKEDEEDPDKAFFDAESAKAFGRDCGLTFAVKQWRNADSAFFKFNDHYMVPFTLTDGRSVFFAFEGERTAVNWVKYIEARDYKVGVGVQDHIYSENMLGVFITKSAYLIHYEYLGLSDSLVPLEYFDPITGIIHNRLHFP